VTNTKRRKQYEQRLSEHGYDYQSLLNRKLNGMKIQSEIRNRQTQKSPN